MRLPRSARSISVAVVIASAGFFAAACGSSSASPPSTTAPAVSKLTPIEWLSSNARQWNARLNGDQTRVAAAAAATSGESSSAFFSRLNSLCTKLRDDAQHAMDAQQAPIASLQQAWHGMLSATEEYASKCLRLAHSDSTADVNAWQESLTSMNNANSKFNQVANAAAKPSSTTPSPSTTSTTSGSSH